VSNRSRFPVLFELYSTRFGTATPNPNLGPERARNFEVGWSGNPSKAAHLSAAVFYNDVPNLIQTVQLPDSTTQYQNVGTGKFTGFEVAIDAHGSKIDVGANYTLLNREIADPLQPLLQPIGVPTHKAFLYATWHATKQLRVTPALDIAGDRWSDYSTTPVQVDPFIRTGAYQLLSVDGTYAISRNLELAIGAKNLLDQNFELAWGFPQPGRTFYVKTKLSFF
jgi:iron complex outermembrane receptor protein